MNKDIYYGVSTFQNIEDAKKIKNKIPGKKLKGIAKGFTKEDDGVVRKTPKKSNSHITWWLFENAKPENYFEIVKEEMDNE